MKDLTLFTVALICSVLGIIILFFISDNITISQTNIHDIDSIEPGKTVKIIGRIERASDTEKVMFLTVGQEKIETVSVVLFKSSNITLKQGDYVEITGTVEEYQGAPEVIASRVRII